MRFSTILVVVAAVTGTNALPIPQFWGWVGDQIADFATQGPGAVFSEIVGATPSRMAGGSPFPLTNNQFTAGMGFLKRWIDSQRAVR
ncbi:hypothetical protein TWF106_004387 [Orbilia oligospora]|uniref:Uncharacterized protein n=2 Tax=Orbilia oligospora TaxID=2813651 RepID=A0A7C8K9S0_ORBOL|nr:hypothetical protein TWF788_000583 [Orbilia oligospora]KAF3224185.1 hypothetical protein TWF106_004387 [Orbilia oligospora]